MFSRLKTLPLTIALTILIWMYAEAEFTSSQEGVPMKLQIQSTDPNQYSLRALDDAGVPLRTVELSLTLQGAKGQIERIVQQARAPHTADAIASQLTITRNGGLVAKGSMLYLVPALNELPFFRDKGVTVVACSPDRVKLDVDHLRHEFIPLESRMLKTNGVQLTVSSFEPKSIEVVIPETLYDQIGKSINLVAEPQSLVTGDMGVLRSVPVRIIATDSAGNPLADRDDRVTVSHQEVTCNLTVTAAYSARYKPGVIPIMITGSAAVLSPYRIDIIPAEVAVEAVGTNAIIEKLRQDMERAPASPQESLIRAYVDLTADDKPGATPIIKQIRYSLPPGVVLDKKVDKVEVRLTPNVAPPPPPPPATAPATAP